MLLTETSRSLAAMGKGRRGCSGISGIASSWHYANDTPTAFAVVTRRTATGSVAAYTATNDAQRTARAPREAAAVGALDALTAPMWQKRSILGTPGQHCHLPNDTCTMGVGWGGFGGRGSQSD